MTPILGLLEPQAVLYSITWTDEFHLCETFFDSTVHSFIN